MARPGRSPLILVAEDDPDDRNLHERALRQAKLSNPVRFVYDGEQLLEYLRREGRYAEEGSAPRPGVVLLDLNMPKMDGREALAAMKRDPVLRKIPVVVFSTSSSEEDILRAYELGVNSFISKPACFDELVSVMAAVGRYWFQVAALPGPFEAR